MSRTYVAMCNNDDIWSLPPKANQAKVAGDPQRLTKNISKDWVCDLSTGADMAPILLRWPPDFHIY